MQNPAILLTLRPNEHKMFLCGENNSGIIRRIVVISIIDLYENCPHFITHEAGRDLG